MTQVSHSEDSMRYAFGPLMGREPLDHEHVLVKDPTRLGWQCRLLGCGFFKPAEEFDDVPMVGGGS